MTGPTAHDDCPPHSTADGRAIEPRPRYACTESLLWTTPLKLVSLSLLFYTCLVVLVALSLLTARRADWGTGVLALPDVRRVSDAS